MKPEVIQEHRHPEKNKAIMQISFKLGLRAQEISLLQIKEVARLDPSGMSFEILEVMSLPASLYKRCQRHETREEPICAQDDKL